MAAFRKLYESRGLQLTSVNPTFLDINMASPNPGIREESIRQLRETVQLAHDIGAGIVIAPAGRKHALIAPDPSYLWGLVKEALRSLLPDCERLGVTFGLDNAYSVIPTAELMLQMCKELAGARRSPWDLACPGSQPSAPAAGGARG